ncbi:hypothetical protein ACJX0J_034407, partial [Zea mays]
VWGRESGLYCLQETNKKVFNHNWLDSISGQNIDLLVGFNSETFEIYLSGVPYSIQGALEMVFVGGIIVAWIFGKRKLRGAIIKSFKMTLSEKMNIEINLEIIKLDLWN